MPVIVAELLRRGVARLKDAGIEDVEISARLLLQHVLNKTNSELQLMSGNKVTEENIQLFDELVGKRCDHVPVQYLIGEVEFYNVKLKTDNRALVPRPETEVLVERLVELAKTLKSPALLDVGTGSGNIAIALAFNIDNISITAIDISQESLDLAKLNAKKNGVAEKIDFIRTDCMQNEFWDNCGKYDIIVSNPPYVDDDDFGGLQPEIKRYEPRAALITGGDPFIFFKCISSQAKKILKPTGIICFEVGATQADRVAEIIKSNFLNIDIAIVKDLTGIERIVIGEIH